MQVLVDTADDVLEPCARVKPLRSYPSDTVLNNKSIKDTAGDDMNSYMLLPTGNSYISIYVTLLRCGTKSRNGIYIGLF